MDANRTGKACLYMVATPLGNLDDITGRAVEILRRVPVIACEDTRHSRRLFQRYGIDARLISYHEHNEQQAAARIVTLVETGTEVALVCDAGTPGISDPGYRVVRLALERGIQVVPVPGPSAVTTALCISGLPTDSFYFSGFLPARDSAVRRKLAELAKLPATLVFYCPARRIGKVLGLAAEILGNRQAALCRELTKVHEEALRGRLQSIEKELKERPAVKGEIVLLVAGYEGNEDRPEEEKAGAVEEFLDRLDRAETVGARRLTALVSEKLGLPRNRVYPLVCGWLNRKSAG
ncbi:MAG: 16S rRNA (cytidine(1402)-2'-O)-methyltransferase [Candidatus Glassbacteria bacterium]